MSLLLPAGDRSRVVRLYDQPFDPSKHTLLFTHIPKCGGTSLHMTFQKALGGPEKYRIFTGLAEQRENMEGLIGGGGHQPFALNPLHRFRGGNFVYVSMLREPFARFSSFFHHLRRDTQHYLVRKNPVVARMAPRELIRYLDEISEPSVRNFQAAMLAPGAKTAHEAIERIEQNYSIIGVLENMKGFMTELQKLFPTAELQTFDANKTKDFIEPIELTNPLLHAKVREINDIDYEIYQYFYEKSSS